VLAGCCGRAVRPLLIGGSQAVGDERTVRRDWRRRPGAVQIVKSFTIGAMVAARVHEKAGRRAIGGFTLIELMIVVVVIAVLAAIALPSFLSSVRKSRRAEAVSATAQIQQAQERFRANCPCYAHSVSNAVNAACPATCPGTAGDAGLGIAAAAGARYTYALSATTAAGYTVTATAVAGSSQAADTQGGTACSPLVVTVTNGNSARTPAACWSN
jgi:type IV pilus assembly protein PilE